MSTSRRPATSGEDDEESWGWRWWWHALTTYHLCVSVRECVCGREADSITIVKCVFHLLSQSQPIPIWPAHHLGFLVRATCCLRRHTCSSSCHTECWAGWAHWHWIGHRDAQLAADTQALSTALTFLAKWEGNEDGEKERGSKIDSFWAVYGVPCSIYYGSSNIRVTSWVVNAGRRKVATLNDDTTLVPL